MEDGADFFEGETRGIFMGIVMGIVMGIMWDVVDRGHALVIYSC